MQVKFQDNHVWRASTRRRKLGKKWRSTGSVFSLPTESLWDYTQYSHNLRQDPCSGPVPAPEGQNFSAVLSPSNYKWQKRFHCGKRYYWLCQLHSTSSPPHRHGRATLECFFPWQPLHSYPQDQAQSLTPTMLTPQGRQVRDCSCWLQHPSLRKLDFVVLLMHHFLLLPSQP